ncbi:bifunctional 4-hydroxy-2-oxoglutarate aldolase/2-dehydro-3-deoxy-phosphogluconate aldolase [Priestia megaterium]
MINILKKSGIIAVVRGSTHQEVIEIGKALAEGGVKFMEITVETPKAMSLIERVSDELQSEIFIGAGTVLDPETARAAILSGASYIVSPTLNVETIKITKRYGKVSIPGAMTPTEILKAYEHGADAVKVFPSGILGSQFIKDLKGPLSHIPLIATGGITLSNIEQYFKAGVLAVGIGNTLVNKDMIKDRQFEALAYHAKKHVEIISRYTN